MGAGGPGGGLFGAGEKLKYFGQAARRGPGILAREISNSRFSAF